MNQQNFQVYGRKIASFETSNWFLEETTIFFVLDGQLSVQQNLLTFPLSKGKLFVGNIHDQLILTNKTEQDSLLFYVEIDNLYLTSMYPNYVATDFDCQPEQNHLGKQGPIEEIRKYLCELFLAFYGNDKRRELLMSTALNQVLLWLIQYFSKEKTDRLTYIRNDKVKESLEYIRNRCQEPILMEEVASRLYLSSSTFSKLFKQETGQYFSVYLTQLRLRNSLKDLIFSRKTIEEIASSNGFGSGKTYRQQFKTYYHLSPSDYRKKMQQEKNWQRNPSSDQIERDCLECQDILGKFYYYAYLPKETSRTVATIEKHKSYQISMCPQPMNKHAERIIHVGALENLLELETFQQLEQLVEEIGVSYIGIHSLEVGNSHSYRLDHGEQLKIFSSFGKFDMILTYLKKHQIGLFYEISLQEYAMLNQTVKYQYLAFLEHVKTYYGESLLAHFKLSCTIHPIRIREGEKLYKQIAYYVHQISPAIQLGVSIPLRYPDYQFVSQKSQDIFLNNLVPQCDFLSYRSEPNLTYQSSDKLPTQVTQFQEYVYKEMRLISDKLKSYGVKHPIYLVEWNTLTSSDRYVNGTYFRGALILQEMLKLDRIIEGQGCWLNAGLYEEFTQQPRANFDGLILFHNYNGARPTYFILKLIKRLKGQEMAFSDNYLLLKHRDTYQLVLWNTKYFSPDLSKEASFLESQSVGVRIEIPEIPSKLYQMKRLDFNRHNGAIFYDCLAFNSRAPIDYEAHRYLAENCRPKMSLTDVEVKNGFQFECIIDINGIVLLELTPINCECEERRAYDLSRYCRNTYR
ncbi:helix-turn-helix domain-containing protein [Vagococcus humatus]|uniref:HTH araC/xylS-type domain-containing protein n=1 Tax=Vagococcus humatus TaxID=1889241 RepID=A0A3R9YFR1_9ENTE|nr:helix-turn-helix domain-containing protein [Vagococcus humatus]RST90109.1 hypothetical protein C7P63_03245 [Vagococcus humatus]